MLCEEEESSMSVISTNSHAVVHKFCLLCVHSQFLRFVSVQRGGSMLPMFLTFGNLISGFITLVLNS
jgi:hypothetical protein